jgi:hypothetical protein
MELSFSASSQFYIDTNYIDINILYIEQKELT